MMPVALAISPHLDDAVFSCGGTLARLAVSGFRVVVATLFTRSMPDPQGFALACQLDKGLDASVDYMALRRQEDAIACGHLGAQARWLPFAEAPHRGYESAAELFGPVDAGDRIGEHLHPALRDLVESVRPTLLLAPQAIGGHVDHVVTARAIRALATKLPVLWWRDFPYVTRHAACEPCAADLAGLADCSVDVEPEPRRSACAAYASQLGYQFGGESPLAALLAEAGPVECFRGERITGLPSFISNVSFAELGSS